MRISNVACFLSLLFLGAVFMLVAEGQNSSGDIKHADHFFEKGKFEEAENLYGEVLAANPDNFHAYFQLGYIALLSNRLSEAENYLYKAIELKPEEKKAKSFLAEVYYRQDKFKQAALLFYKSGNEIMAKKLESFKGIKPYDIKGETDSSHLKFVVTDPLPVVQVRVNDGEAVNFLVDTGGSELIIDSEFAQEAGAVSFGSETGTFAGGKQAAYQHGRIDSFSIGDFAVRNVPVHIQNVRQFSQAIFGGMRVDGIIGTVLLYHFISTLDYPQAELILRRKTKENLKKLEQEAKAEKHIVVPFWMAGDHYMVAWGRVNKSEPFLFFVDTGMAGGGFTCPESTLKKAGIKLQEEKAGEGVGGGGKVRVIPFMVDELTLGDAKKQNIQGLFVGTFQLEKAFGFHIGGLISHAFFRPYALTFDFMGMRLFLKRKE